MLEIVQEFIDESRQAPDQANLEVLFESAVGQLGFDGFAAWTISDPNSPPADAVWVSRYPREWADYYIDQTLFNVDPTVHMATVSNVPFRWSDLVKSNGLSRAQRDFLLEAADAGMGIGVSVPIHMHAAAPGTVGVSGPLDDMRPEAMHSVHLMSVYLYEAARRFSIEASGGRLSQPTLTARECECLKWAAIGKTDWEIGEILGISQSTAHFHIEKAKKKFGVSTRTQAVVQAVVTNQIIP
ncbi:MAG: LuxR family transcriptional regulator [Alphaproteobacteria bacterium]